MRFLQCVLSKRLISLSVSDARWETLAYGIADTARGKDSNGDDKVNQRQSLSLWDLHYDARIAPRFPRWARKALTAKPASCALRTSSRSSSNSAYTKAQAPSKIAQPTSFAKAGNAAINPPMKALLSL